MADPRPRPLKGRALQASCQNKSREGTFCGATHEPDQHRAIARETGPARTRRHNGIHDPLARWLAERSPAPLCAEQTAP